MPIDLILLWTGQRNEGHKEYHLLRLLKMLRVPRLAQLLDVEKFRTMVNMYYSNQLDRSVNEGQFDYHYPVLKAIQINYIYRLVSVVAIILSSSYFLGIFWKIIVTNVIDW